jgi:CRP-like cAMP-binding protein
VPITPEIYVFIVNEETFPDKAVIFEEGGHGTWAYIILEGKVKVTKNTPKGKATIFTLGKGEIIGEVGLMEGGTGGRTTSVVADGPVVMGLLDTNRLVEEFNALSPQLRKFLATLAKRLGDSINKVVADMGKLPPST